MTFINCADAGLETYSPTVAKPWNRQRAMHLFRRISLGLEFTAVENSLGQNPQQIIDTIIENAATLPLTPEPEWAYWNLDDYDPDPDIRGAQIVDQILTWSTQFVRDIKDNGLRDRMTFFWHNHFVTKLDDYQCPSWMYEYHKLLQQHAMGNFRDFVRDMGLSSAMLVFLNGVQNTQFEPNENYARELYELFSLGLDNGYTQTDITETARALTGYNNLDVLCNPITFLPAFFDNGQKTIFGQTGNWDYNDVIDILFQERAVEISEYICKKLYVHFVNPREDEEIISQLATIFRNNDFEIRPVLEAMFKSEHFFDEAHFGTVIPGHIEYFLMLFNELNFDVDDELLLTTAYLAGEFGQRIFNPIDVAGWPGNRLWINTNSINERWTNTHLLISNQYFNLNENIFGLFAIALCGENENDPAVISRTIADYLLPNGLQFEAEYERITTVLKGEVPENYYQDGSWDLNWETAPAQVATLVYYISLFPEFQLR